MNSAAGLTNSVRLSACWGLGGKATSLGVNPLSWCLFGFWGGTEFGFYTGIWAQCARVSSPHISILGLSTWWKLLMS